MHGTRSAETVLAFAAMIGRRRMQCHRPSGRRCIGMDLLWQKIRHLHGILLDRVATRCGWRVFAWALMNNHFHLYLRTPWNCRATFTSIRRGQGSSSGRRSGHGAATRTTWQ